MTIDDFFEGIDKVLKSDKFLDCSYPVYRGHSQESYKLLATLQRDFKKTDKDILTLENNLYCDFRSLVGPRVKFDSSWETLFAMRHEGIPTRLLDWTENLGTALFFAFDSSKLEKPHIWILNPYALNKMGDSCVAALQNPEEDLEDYNVSYGNCTDSDSLMKIHELPIAVYPRRTNERIFAQRGLFTIHGANENSMEVTCPDCIEKVDIPEELIEKLKKILKQFGINKYSVYPDFKGLSEYLKNYYNY